MSGSQGGFGAQATGGYNSNGGGSGYGQGTSNSNSGGGGGFGGGGGSSGMSSVNASDFSNRDSYQAAQNRADAIAYANSSNMSNTAGYNGLGAAANQQVSNGSLQNSDAGRGFGDRGGIMGTGLGWDGSGKETSHALSQLGLGLAGMIPGVGTLLKGYGLAKSLGDYTGAWSLGQLGLDEYGGGYKDDGVRGTMFGGYDGSQMARGGNANSYMSRAENTGQPQQQNQGQFDYNDVVNYTGQSGLAPIGTLSGPSSSFIGSRGESSATDILSGNPNQGQTRGYSLSYME